MRRLCYEAGMHGEREGADGAVFRAVVERGLDR